MPPITPAELAERRVRVITRPWGLVVLTGVLGRNTEAFRWEVLAWLRTPEGAVWLGTEGAAS